MRDTRQYALITGASEGIGRALARRFAADGHPVILVARSQTRLEELAQQLEAEFSVTAVVMRGDLADPNTPSRLFQEVTDRSLQVDYLVNNAGFGATGLFSELDLHTQSEMIEVNIAALTKMTHLFVAPMIERKRGRILNVASIAGFQAGPYMAVYFATKAYVISFSEALSHELRGSGVTVTAHCPGATATAFSERAGNEKTRLFQKNAVAQAAPVAEHAYRAMQAGKPLAIYGALHWMLIQSLRFSPRASVRFATGWLNTPGDRK